MTGPDTEWTRLGTIREAVVKVIGDHYGLYGRVLRLDLELERDLGSDRLDKLEILMTLEELFDVYFSPVAAERASTIGDVIVIVEEALLENEQEEIHSSIDQR